MVSRTSFSTPDYLSYVLNSVSKSKEEDNKFITSLIASSFISAIAFSFITTYLPAPTSIKNTIGLLSLFLPYLFLLLSTFAPSIFKGKSPLSKANEDELTERICYHEAGHFLLGYICGIPVLSYDVTGSVDASLTVQIPLFDLKKAGGSVLITAMGGIVAESLRFGDVRGGNADIELVVNTLRYLRSKGVIDTKDSNFDAHFRWALLKALTLLRIHRESLDEVAQAMKEGESIVSCIEAVEADSMLK
jgi:hypothetical protein